MVHHMDWRSEVWRRFRRDLPGMVAIWVVVAIAVAAWGAIQGELVDLPGLLLALVVLGIALTPLIWMRYEIPLVRGRQRTVRRSLGTVGVGCLWAVIVLVVGFSILGALGLD